jgi:hypothetical protein
LEGVALRQEKVQKIGDASVLNRELAIGVSFAEPEFGVREHTPLCGLAGKAGRNGRTAAVPENLRVASGCCELERARLDQTIQRSEQNCVHVPIPRFGRKSLQGDNGAWSNIQTLKWINEVRSVTPTLRATGGAGDVAELWTAVATTVETSR